MAPVTATKQPHLVLRVSRVRPSWERPSLLLSFSLRPRRGLPEHLFQGASLVFFGLSKPKTLITPVTWYKDKKSTYLGQLCNPFTSPNDTSIPQVFQSSAIFFLQNGTGDEMSPKGCYKYTHPHTHRADITNRSQLSFLLSLVVASESYSAEYSRQLQMRLDTQGKSHLPFLLIRENQSWVLVTAIKTDFIQKLLQ